MYAVLKSVIVIVKHRAFCLPGGTFLKVFQCLGRQKKLLCCGLLGEGGVITQADAMHNDAFPYDSPTT